VERPPIEMREPRARIADEIEQDRIAAAAAGRLATNGAGIVARRQPHAELADVRITERIARQELRIVLEHQRRARYGRGSLASHAPRLTRTMARVRRDSRRFAPCSPIAPRRTVRPSRRRSPPHWRAPGRPL